MISLATFALAALDIAGQTFAGLVLAFAIIVLFWEWLP
jgi:hypothetical protein